MGNPDTDRIQALLLLCMMAGRGQARGGGTSARRDRLNSKDSTGSGKQPGDIKEEASCQLFNKIYGEEDNWCIWEW